MATVTIKLKSKGNGIDWDPKNPKASKDDTVRWECDEGPWWIVFKTGAGPLNQPGLNGGKGKGNGKGSQVKVKGPKKYYYAAAIWNASANKFCTADPPLDIVPGTSLMKPRKQSKKKRPAKKRSRAKR